MEELGSMYIAYTNGQTSYLTFNSSGKGLGVSWNCYFNYKKCGVKDRTPADGNNNDIAVAILLFP